MHYSELTLRHFENPIAAGELFGRSVRRGGAGTPLLGTWVQFDVRVTARPTEEIVDAVRFLAFGCPHVIAVADWLAQAAVGQAAAPRLPETIHRLRERFDMPVEKLGRLVIIEDAWIAAFSSPHRI